MARSTILKGIRIVDMTTVIFGPYATATLADMGAEVIKVEPARGDEVRRVGRPVATRGMGPAHMTLNRGKRSVSWDLRSAAGRRALDRLIRRSDVFVHNLRGEAIDRLALGYDAVKALREDIVYVRCSGFGSDGPYADRAAYDDIIQAASGAAALLPLADGDDAPRYLPMAMADKVSGLHAVYAVLGALFHRERSGQGQEVEVPMFESFTHFLLQEHMYGRTFVPPNDPAGYPRQLDPARHPLRTLDGHVAIAPYTDDRWVRFFAVAGEPGYLDGAGLTNARERFAALDRIQAHMASIVATRPTAYWLELMARHDIPASPVNTLEEVFDDPHLRAVGFFNRREHPTEGDYMELRLPVRFGVAEGTDVSPAPGLGEHSDDVLRELVDDD